jgi:hypothetical protein
MALAARSALEPPASRSPPGHASSLAWDAARDRMIVPLVLAGIGLAAVVIQLRLGVYTDELWLMLLCDRLLDGQVAYRDFIENSPPAAILLYMPPVALARLLGVAREPVLLAYVVAVIGLSFAFCWRILASAGCSAKVGSPGAIVGLAALLLLPDYEFGQRDHIAVALAMPLLTALGIRACGGVNAPRAAIGAGALAGLVCAIRPHYALAFALAFAFVGWRRGFRSLLGFGEVFGAGASALALAGASYLFFPHYFDTALPIALAVYVADRHSMPYLLLKPAAASWALLGAAFLLQWRRARENPFAIVAALASAGAMASYVIQAKGFPYHAYFAVAAMLAAVAIAGGAEFRRPILPLVAALAFFCAWYADFGGDAAGALRIELVAALVAILALAVPYSLASIAAPLCAAAAGLAFALALAGFHYEWRATPIFLDEARALVAHPKVAAISDIGEVAHPLVSRLGGRWMQSVVSLVISHGADQVLERDAPDAATRERLERYKALDRDLFFRDVAREPPDIVIVNETWAAEHFVDQRLAPWLSGFRERT